MTTDEQMNTYRQMWAETLKNERNLTPNLEKLAEAITIVEAIPVSELSVPGKMASGPEGQRGFCPGYHLLTTWGFTTTANASISLASVLGLSLDEVNDLVFHPYDEDTSRTRYSDEAKEQSRERVLAALRNR